MDKNKNNKKNNKGLLISVISLIIFIIVLSGIAHTMLTIIKTKMIKHWLIQI